MQLPKIQLQKQDEPYQPAVKRVAGVHNSSSENTHALSTTVIPASIRKPAPSTTAKTPAPNAEEEYRSAVSRVARTNTSASTRKQTMTTDPTSTNGNGEALSVSSHSAHSDENEQHRKHPPQIRRVPQAESAMSVKKQLSTKTNKSSNITTTQISKNSNPDSTNGSFHPFLSSSTNLMSKSEIFDQDFHLGDSSDQEKNRGKINISGREK